MTTNEPNAIVTLAGITGVVASASSAPEAGTVDDLIAKIKSTDDDVRSSALENIGSGGAPAVKPLAAMLTDSDFETVRVARAPSTASSTTQVAPARSEKPAQ